MSFISNSTICILKKGHNRSQHKIKYNAERKSHNEILFPQKFNNLCKHFQRYLKIFDYSVKQMR